MIRAIPCPAGSNLRPGDYVTPAADEAKYHHLGETYDRGDKRRVMSRSQLALFDDCPREWMDGATVERTKAMDWGTLMDARITNPAALAKYVQAPAQYHAPESKKKDALIVAKAWNMNADICKAWWDLQIQDGRTPVKHEIWEASKLATVALCRDKIAGAFVASCQFQVQVLVEWVDEITGIIVPLKCLVDLVPHAPGMGGLMIPTKFKEFGTRLGDFKTANDLSAHGWQRTVFDQDYHVQAALYLDAWNAATGENRNTFVHILQRSTAPFQTARRMLSEEYLELGRLTYRRQLSRYCRSLAVAAYMRDALQNGREKFRIRLLGDGIITQAKHDLFAKEGGEEEFARSTAWPDYDSDRQEFGEIIDGFRLVSPLPWMIGA